MEELQYVGNACLPVRSFSEGGEELLNVIQKPPLGGFLI